MRRRTGKLEGFYDNSSFIVLFVYLPLFLEVVEIRRKVRSVFADEEAVFCVALECKDVFTSGRPKFHFEKYSYVSHLYIN